eukprot:TRINITY_DN12298_c1_g1_i1.p1 TRINITY_DN12298_c1_g1~~TRINITY_DN12298_c1_g1_i1.p1  ORF type:complete len:140 (+),score=24.00 TRINITY_DN12298_c1_g1_i1:488-907(+)
MNNIKLGGQRVRQPRKSNGQFGAITDADRQSEAVMVLPSFLTQAETKSLLQHAEPQLTSISLDDFFNPSVDRDETTTVQSVEMTLPPTHKDAIPMYTKALEFFQTNIAAPERLRTHAALHTTPRMPVNSRTRTTWFKEP